MAPRYCLALAVSLLPLLVVGTNLRHISDAAEQALLQSKLGVEGTDIIQWVNSCKKACSDSGSGARQDLTVQNSIILRLTFFVPLLSVFVSLPLPPRLAVIIVDHCLWLYHKLTLTVLT